MKNVKSLIAMMAFSLIVLGVPAIASAQYGGYGNGNGNGQYGNDIRGTIQDLKYKAHNFEQQTDRNSNSRYGGYNNGNIENLADRFSNAVNKLEDKYGRGRNLRNSEDEARRVLDIAMELDNAVYNSSNGRGGRGGRGGYGNNGNYVGDQWSQMSNDLRIIAREYGYRYNGGGYNNNRNNYPNGNNGGWGNGRKPSWWPF